MRTSSDAQTPDLTPRVIEIIETTRGLDPPENHSSMLRDALERGVDYLLGQQFDDGHWEDYELPQGKTDAWVTAYLGRALAEAGQRLERRDAAGSAKRAVNWLKANRPYTAGWGYNAISGPDADTTAFVLMAFRSMEEGIEERDVAWLMEHWQPEGGFSTYLKSDPLGMGVWSKAHPDVTATSYLALPAPLRAKLRADAAVCLERWRRSDGTWPAYWWRTCHYSTYWNLQVARVLGVSIPAVPPVVNTGDTYAVQTLFDLACVTGVSCLQMGPSATTLALAEELAAHQASDGSWPGGPNLRVTNPATAEPWNVTKGRGKLYVDMLGLITTASAISTLDAVLSRPGQPAS